MKYIIQEPDLVMSTRHLLNHLNVQHFRSGDFKSGNGDVRKGGVPEPGLLDVDGLQSHRVHDVDPDEVE